MRQLLTGCALACVFGCGGGPEPASDAADPKPTRPAPPPEWPEPLTELLGGATEEADLLELAPQLLELVPARGDDDARELDKVFPWPVDVVRTPLGAGWEALDFELCGADDRFVAWLEAIDTRFRRLVHVRRAAYIPSDGDLSWQIHGRAYVQASALVDGEHVRAALRRTAQLTQGYVPPSLELSQLSALCEDLSALYFNLVSFTERGVKVEGHSDDPELPRTLAARLEAGPSAFRYEVALEQTGSSFTLNLTREPRPRLPPLSAAPEALRDSYTAELGPEREAFREVFARVRSEGSLRERVTAARWLESRDEGHLAQELLFAGLESAEGYEWAEGILAFALLEIPKQAFSLNKAKDLLLRAQSLQWPVFAEIAEDEALKVLRDDPTFLLDLLLADRDVHLAPSRRDPFLPPAPPPPEPPPAERELANRLKGYLRDAVYLLQMGEREEALTRVAAFKEVLAELRPLNAEAAEEWEARLAELGDLEAR